MTSLNDKKRKKGYEEDDDGFTFTRVKKKKPLKSTTDLNAPISTIASATASTSTEKKSSTRQQEPPPAEAIEERPVKKRRNRLSFSTPTSKQTQPVRRSKRLSAEHDAAQTQPHVQILKSQAPEATGSLPKSQKQMDPEKKPPQMPQEPAIRQQPVEQSSQQEVDLSGTKIALPFADTPVIRRNKAMREGRGSKGERRSSLGFRGRRASSLIETGNSNGNEYKYQSGCLVLTSVLALPHSEVQISDFYKHIESSSLPEPRRMRQLLTWCATRALDPKPIGTDFEDASARSAARVIEEELLKELGNRSDLSDWFSREDAVITKAALPERPNPKNIQNSIKIAELENQIASLRRQRDELDALTRQSRPDVTSNRGIENHDDGLIINTALLSDSDATFYQILRSSQQDTENIVQRFHAIQRSLQPTVDTFADGIHAISQYRSAADGVASCVLTSCADKLEDREKEGRRQALQDNSSASPHRDLSDVLRGLSRVDR